MDIERPTGRLSRRRAVLGAVVSAVVLAGCSRTRLLDALTPEGDYNLAVDIAYGEHPRQRLDIYRPQRDEARAVVVYYYGGSWRSGAKETYRFVAESLTRHGLTVVVPDYRLHPEVVFPAFVEDAALAARWVRDNVPAAGAGRRLFLAGHSAGAHIATLLALDPRYLGEVGMQPRDLSGVIGISGPYDFLPIASARVRAVFAGTADLAATQPIAFAGPGAPPMLLVHGTADALVYPRNSERLAARLRAAGAPVRLAIYPGRGHLDILLGLSSALAGDNRLMADLLDFIADPA